MLHSFQGPETDDLLSLKTSQTLPTLPSTVTNVHTKQAVQTADLCSNEAVSLVDHLLHRLHIILSQPAGRVPDNLYTNTLFSFKVCPKKQEPCFPSIKFHDFVKKVELEGINFFFQYSSPVKVITEMGDARYLQGTRHIIPCEQRFLMFPQKNEGIWKISARRDHRDNYNNELTDGKFDYCTSKI